MNTIRTAHVLRFARQIGHLVIKPTVICYFTTVYQISNLPKTVFEFGHFTLTITSITINMNTLNLPNLVNVLEIVFPGLKRSKLSAKVLFSPLL